MSSELSAKIKDIMEKELQSMGSSILSKQCQHLDLDADDIEPEDLPALAGRLSETVKTCGGFERARRIYKEIRKLEDLDALADRGETEESKLSMMESLAKASMYAGEWDKAIKYFDRLLNSASARKDVKAKARYLIWLGVLHKERSEYDMAMTFLEKALAEAASSEDGNLISKCHYRIGDIHWFKGEFEKALKSFELAAEKADAEADIGAAHIGLANIYGSRMDLSSALKHYIEALAHLKNTNSYQDIARAYNNLGDTYLQLEDWDNALDCFAKGEEFGRKGGWMHIVAYTQFNSATALVHKGELDKAKEMIDRSMDVLRNIDSKAGFAGAYHAYGLLYQKKKDWKNMARFYDLAVSLYTEIKVPMYVAKCRLEVGLGYREMGDRQKAEKQLKEALRIFEQLQMGRLVDRTAKELKRL